MKSCPRCGKRPLRKRPDKLWKCPSCGFLPGTFENPIDRAGRAEISAPAPKASEPS